MPSSHNRLVLIESIPEDPLITKVYNAMISISRNTALKSNQYLFKILSTVHCIETVFKFDFFLSQRTMRHQLLRRWYRCSKFTGISNKARLVPRDLSLVTIPRCLIEYSSISIEGVTFSLCLGRTDLFHLAFQAYSALAALK